MQPPFEGLSESNYPRHLAQNRAELREIATAQKQIILCVLAEFAGSFLFPAALGSGSVPVAIFAALAIFGLLVCRIVTAYRLAKALQDTPLVYAILVVVPCLSLILEALLSTKATKRLKAAGVKVGFFGVDPRSL